MLVVFGIPENRQKKNILFNFLKVSFEKFPQKLSNKFRTILLQY